MQDKVRILGIAPYEGMKQVMLHIAEEFDDVDITVFVGDLQQGVEVVQKSFHSNYDVIISRGGTAKLISAQVELPIVDVEITSYDILRALHLASSANARYAIIGFSNITANAAQARELMQCDFDIFTIEDSSQADNALQTIAMRGYNAVLCDVVTKEKARQYGLNAFLISSGEQSIRDAIQRAIKIKKAFYQIKRENNFLRKIIEGQITETVVFDKQGILYYSSLKEENPTLLEILEKELPYLPDTGTHRFVSSVNSVLYTVVCQKISGEAYELSAFYISTTKIPLPIRKLGISYITKEEALRQYYTSFFGVTQYIDSITRVTDKFGSADRPIMLYGERGTGKELIVGFLYAQSARSGNPLITIDCTLLNDKSRSYLFNHYASPLNDINSTIYIKNIDALSQNQHRELVAAIININVHRQNKLYFSCASQTEEAVSGHIAELVEQLGCFTFNVPPLRANPQNIPALANLALSNANLHLPREIMGLSPQAMRLLQSYPWPHNFTQLKRVMDELTITADAPIIDDQTVRRVLQKEVATFADRILPMEPQLSVKLEGTLEEITRKVILSVLADCDGNQSVAAKRLGISRTTVWRAVGNQ